MICRTCGGVLRFLSWVTGQTGKYKCTACEQKTYRTFGVLHEKKDG